MASRAGRSILSLSIGSNKFSRRRILIISLRALRFVQLLLKLINKLVVA